MKEQHRKKILIAGLGKSGLAAARLLSGQQAELFGYDDKNDEAFPPESRRALDSLGVPCFLGREPDFFDFDQVIVSPGMGLGGPVLGKCRQAGAEIIGELELAYRNSRSPFVAITGTNGKTTTTALVGEMYRLGGRPCRVVGNIGVPVADQVLAADERTVMVTEVSSFQLETIVDFHPFVSAVLNITPDHLDRHGSLEEYIRVKWRIAENQKEGDFCVFNGDDDFAVRTLPEDLKAKPVPFSAKRALDFGVFARDGRIFIAGESGGLISVCPTADVRIPGAHNLENALAATAIAYFSAVPLEGIREALRSFAGVEHRIEFVARVAGVSYINDSKGTNADAALKAIFAVPSPLLLIAGGYEKHGDFDPFTAVFEGRVEHLLLLGETAERIAQSARKNGFSEERMHFCQDMEDCVAQAARLARPGDAVLLSPACASWDMYSNFEERGRHFKQLVRALEPGLRQKKE